MHILIVEDDQDISENIASMLQDASYQTTAHYLLDEAMISLEINSYDAIILDWMLPDGEGIDLIKKLREQKNSTPILMLTAKSQIEDLLEGFEVGADDYLKKPFKKDELLARIKSLIRRKNSVEQTPVISIGHIDINTNDCTVRSSGNLIELSPKEYSLLEYLARNKGKVVDRLEILHHVWGEDVDPFSNTVDVHVSSLRKKIDIKKKASLIKTVKQKGYMV